MFDHFEIKTGTEVVSPSQGAGPKQDCRLVDYEAAAAPALDTDNTPVTVTVKSGTGARGYRVRRSGWNTLADPAGRAEARRRPRCVQN
jgi:hypothetical protein